MINILLVEDSEEIASALSFTLSKQNYNVTIANSIAKAEDFVDNDFFSLVLFDVTLPDGNGFDFYKDVIMDKKIATIFLTAKDEENDIVRGLDMGAEDYITKPFSTRELMARINRVLMRAGHSTVFRAGDISFDVDKMEATRGYERIELSSLELKILHLLFVNHDKAVSRAQVIDCIWKATGNDVYDHTVTVYLKRIREKLGSDIITTIKGVGYRIDVNT